MFKAKINAQMKLSRDKEPSSCMWLWGSRKNLPILCQCANFTSFSTYLILSSNSVHTIIIRVQLDTSGTLKISREFAQTFPMWNWTLPLEVRKWFHNLPFWHYRFSVNLSTDQTLSSNRYLLLLQCQA